jgi:hypothetical protein
MPSGLTIQTFGDRINLQAGVFHKIPRIDDVRLAEIFAREVLEFLVRKELFRPTAGSWRLLSTRVPGR